MFGVLIRSTAKLGANILTFPVAANINKLFRAYGVTVGTLILIFILVNSIWLLPIIALSMQNHLPALSHLGLEISSGILLTLGNYFYAFPAGGLVRLAGEFFLQRGRNDGKRANTDYSVYQLLDYLCTVAPLAIWVFTFFSFRIAGALQLFPLVANYSFFSPANFMAYVQFYFPFLSLETAFHTPGFYFSLWGFFMGLASSMQILNADFFARHVRYRDAAKHALQEKWYAPELQQHHMLAAFYILLVAGLLMRPVILHPAIIPGEIQLRVICALFLMLPALFQYGLLIYRKCHKIGAT